MNRYGLEIRAATAADAPGLSELLSMAGLVVPTRTLAERLEALRREQGTALLALEWGPPSGLVMVHWYRTLGADQPTAQITTLLVGSDARRRGIGRLLVKAAAQAGRVAGCTALELRAPADQSDLHEFCRATGFAEFGLHFTRTLRKNG